MMKLEYQVRKELDDTERMIKEYDEAMGSKVSTIKMLMKTKRNVLKWVLKP